jgi:DNA-binding NarL/FixJ family response regulator
MKLNFSSTRTHKILIAASNVLFRRGLQALLAAEPGLDVMADSATEQRILEAIAQQHTDVLVLACEQLAADADFIGRVRLSFPDLVVLVLSDGPWHSGQAFAGVHQVPRRTVPADLVRQIRQSTKRQEACSTASDLRALSDASRKPTRVDVLTQREKEVVRLLAEGMTVREAALELGLSSKTVEAHTLNLMRKLGIHSRASLIGYAVSCGLVEARVPEIA